ncbi:MAG: sodium-dependent bicarbonate transport family permease, partial [Rhodoferax sp.]|nr:sodium-dependent bicarbonate transport family permease [Pseudorhodobacter sp.]
MDIANLIENLVSPTTLAFLLGIIATLIRSDLEIPELVIRIFVIFLLFSIGLQSGRELVIADLGTLPAALAITAALVVYLLGLAFLVAYRILGLDI